MSKLFFLNDYSTVGHPAVMAALAEAGGEVQTGYGTDAHTEAACARIRELTECPEAEVHLLVGGTQTNTTVIKYLLRPWEAVVCDELGHIAVHEAGAIEAVGHKLCTVRTADGKLTPAGVEAVLAAHASEHMVEPRLVYVSNTTEVGTRYTLAEMEALSALCRARGLLLFVDGARLFSALAAPGNDLTLPALARLADAFYIGGTKCGALFGEAVVLCSAAARADAGRFRHVVKQQGGLLAKGFLLGVQFEALLAGTLAVDLAAHSNRMAAILKEGLRACGYELAYGDTDTNQLFFRLPASQVAALGAVCSFMVAENHHDGYVIARLVTSWATREEDCHRLVDELKRIAGK